MRKFSHLAIWAARRSNEKKNEADYEQFLRPVFSYFHGQKNLKKNTFKNIVVSALKNGHPLVKIDFEIEAFVFEII